VIDTTGRARRRRPRWSDEAGFVGGIESIPFGLLVFVVGALLVANAWAVVDAKLATLSAAREAARTYVETVTGGDAGRATVAARQAAVEAIEGHGRDPETMGFGMNPAGAVARCERVQVTVTYRVPALTVPIVGGFGEGFTVRATESEIIDPFRNDVAGGGGAPCR
jgi:hypothetical protein